jgi:hypothetical protein
MSEKRFTGDGYRDRELLAEYLREAGFPFAADTIGTEAIVAGVATALLDHLPRWHLCSAEEALQLRMRELYAVVMEIASCWEAESGPLLTEETAAEARG